MPHDIEVLKKKWQPVLEHSELDPIKSSYVRNTTAILLENQENFNTENAGELRVISEATHANAAGAMADTGGVAKWDPILISLIRRNAPKLIAYEIAGVQPMTGPTGLIFAMKSKYESQGGTEALFDEANTFFSSDTTSATGNTGTDPFDRTADGTSGTNPNFGDTTVGVSSVTGYTVGQAVSTDTAESMGDASTLNEMAFTIEKATVTAKSRALKAEYTVELAQDLKAVHGLDAESELSNILSTEILAETNRELVRTMYICAKSGARKNVTTSGTIDLDTDVSGRWSAERFKGMLFAIEKDANAIARETRRGKGNFIVCSSDVASALSLSGQLDYAPALNTSLSVDDTGTTFAGLLNGRTKVYIDPYFSDAANDFYMVGYRGSSPYDAGLFYCPYVPLQMYRAVGEDTFQPKIAFKSRYGMVANPFANPAAGNAGTLYAGVNPYYRLVRVTNLM